ncbi:MAG: acyltransferase [Pseudomonadaceae bacterium]|nr:acyltransferase [Pseudomonadaceae bacterium]
MTDIDRAKGLAIFLVVLGHIVAGDPPKGNAWFEELVRIVYSFHMPFFMYLSGFVMFYTFKAMDNAAGYFTYVQKKAFRIAPAFILFGIVILLGKMLVAPVMHVDNQPEAGFVQGIVDILLVPGQSAAKGLWFVYVLFEFYLVVPLLLFVFGGRVWPIVLVGLGLAFVSGPPVLMLEGAFEYLIYFSVGMLSASSLPRYHIVLDRFCVLFFLAFLASLPLLYSQVPYPTAKLLIGLLSIPALHGLVRTAMLSRWEFLAVWGLFSFAIYLMNTIAIGLAKGIALKFVSWDGANFLWIAPLIFVAGFVGPIIVKKYIFVYIKPLDRITD